MNDPDDEKLKAEIDKIMSNITKTMKRIEEIITSLPLGDLQMSIINLRSQPRLG